MVCEGPEVFLAEPWACFHFLPYYSERVSQRWRLVVEPCVCEVLDLYKAVLIFSYDLNWSVYFGVLPGGVWGLLPPQSFESHSPWLKGLCSTRD